MRQRPRRPTLAKSERPFHDADVGRGGALSPERPIVYLISDSRDVNNDQPRLDPEAPGRRLGPEPRQRSWPCWAGLATAVSVAFLPSLGCGFVNWDDDANFLDNLYYRGLS